MGLTIHYTVSGRAGMKPTRARRLVAALRERAVALEFEHVTRVSKVGPDYPGIYWRPPGAKRAADFLGATEGWVFHATPGDGSESVMMGLCRFAGREGWWLESFCKTQYASRHGWEHFLRCHSAVLRLMENAEHFGLAVEVEDEGGLWETGSFAVLRKNLEEYGECVAALGGALREAAAADGQKVDAPIFDHPQFEHLEARGMARHAKEIGRAVEAVKQLLR